MSAIGATASPAGLVIFDCDGVLVDSEPLSMRVLLETIAEAGAVIDVAQGYESFLGKNLASVTEILRTEYGVDLGSHALDRMRERLYELFRQELQPIPGIAETLAAMRVPVCVASSSQSRADTPLTRSHRAGAVFRRPHFQCLDGRPRQAGAGFIPPCRTGDAHGARALYRDRG